ncbi:glycerophosphodiester phosphodiesterase [Antribacter gilvus]|uniref:glycerophosphodiester phosphodiesterase n=1 Tax=Antribacter gilvus TaxID=2304675 RepID=UPI000F7AA84E|nr:glycerophosphodiester phosphodiesterase family protein [Antribacter gilvus]
MPGTLRRARTRRSLSLSVAAVAAAAVAFPLLATVPTAAPAAAAPGDVAYTQDFNSTANGGLPAGWRPASGSWAVQDGRLVGQAGSITRITFGPHLENYRLEATIRFEQVNNGTRWLAPILDIAPNGAVPWWQAAMRTNTTAANGLELAQRTSGNAWNVPYTASAQSDAGTGRDVRIAIEVQGTHATWIYDGQERLEGTIERSADGVLGFSADGARISVDDVRVTEIEPWTPVAGEGELPVTAAHRGYSAVTPENTLAAYVAAMRSGAEFVEIDVHTTADGIPVVMHDQTVDRTTDGTGNIALLQSPYVATLDAGSWFSPAFAGQPAPTFAQTLELMRTGSSAMLLEIKGPETQAEVNRVVDMITARGLAGRMVIQSFDANVLRYAKERAPQIPTGYLVSTVHADPVAVSRDLGVSYYNPSAGALTGRPSVVAELNAAGIAVFAWTVDSADHWKQLTAAGVDGIITNRPGAFIGWKQAQAQVPAPDEPTVQVLAPVAGGTFDTGADVVLAASATDADQVQLTVDGTPVDNGTVLAAADLGLGEHTVVARATGAGGDVEATATFTVTVTPAGLRSRLAALPVATGQLQQLLTALEAEDWARLRWAVAEHVVDPATAEALTAEVEHLAG